MDSLSGFLQLFSTVVLYRLFMLEEKPAPEGAPPGRLHTQGHCAAFRCRAASPGPWPPPPVDHLASSLFLSPTSLID